MRSTPIPNANPEIFFGSYPGCFSAANANTAGSTIPQPSSSIHPDCLHFLHPFPPQKMQLICTSAVAESNLNFLQNRLQSQHPPGFVAVDISSEELAYLRKATTILSLHQYAQVNALGAKNAHWDNLLLITVGPVVYLRTRKPELFHATTLLAMDDQALNPFREALNWQGQKTPEWMEKVVGGGGIQETGDINRGSLGKLPQGDGIFVLGNGLSPVISTAFVSACQKLYSPPNPVPPPSKTEQGSNIPTAREERAAAEEQPRSTSRVKGWSRRREVYRATKETDPKSHARMPWRDRHSPIPG